MRDLPHTEDIHDAYSHGCNGIGLSIWIERRGPIWPPPLSSPPLRRRSALCRPTGCVVRMVYALAGRHRSRSVLQPRPVLGPLWIKCRRSVSRRYRRLASPCRQDRWPGKWPVDRSERQRWSCGSDAASITGRCYRFQECLRGVLDQHRLNANTSGTRNAPAIPRPRGGRP
jgi:hypothetical protein